MTTSAVPILAMLPLLVFGGAAVLRPAPDVVPKPVQVEGVTARRMDADTFRRRWPMDLPTPTVIHEVPVPAVAAAAATPAPRPARIVRRASLRTSDVCARHGLAKVEVIRGKWKGWRCRRR